MKIDLNRGDLRKILVEKYGDCDFRLFYTESQKTTEERIGKKYAEMEQPPVQESFIGIID
jgi:hypothetical protein